MPKTATKDSLDKAREQVGELHKNVDSHILADERSLRSSMDAAAASARQIATELSSKNDSAKLNVKHNVTAAIAHLQAAASDSKASATATIDDIKKRNAEMLKDVRGAAQSLSLAVAARRHAEKGN